MIRKDLLVYIHGVINNPTRIIPLSRNVKERPNNLESKIKQKEFASTKVILNN